MGTERVQTSYNGAQEGAYASRVWGDESSTITGIDSDARHYADLDHDSESNTDHAQFRQYSNIQGRWMSPDPYDGSYDYGDPQSFNRYSYVMNRPLSATDPSGLVIKCFIVGNFRVDGELQGSESICLDFPDLGMEAGLLSTTTFAPTPYPAKPAPRVATSNSGCKVINGNNVCPSSLDDNWNLMEVFKHNYRDSNATCSTHATVKYFTGTTESHIDSVNPQYDIWGHLRHDALPDLLYNIFNNYNHLPAGRDSCPQN